MTCGECKHIKSRQNPDFGECVCPVPLWVSSWTGKNNRIVWLTQPAAGICPYFERKEEK